MSRPLLFSALRTARRGASPAAGARSFGRAAIFTGLLVLGRALWLRAASRRFRQIRGTRVGALETQRTTLPPGGASAGSASSGASWSSDRRATSGKPGTAGRSREDAGGASSGSTADLGHVDGPEDVGYVDGTAEDLPPGASA